MKLSEYLRYREMVEASDPVAMVRTQNALPPENATDLALRAAYVILNGGMSWSVAQGIWQRMSAALLEQGDVGATFNHPGKRKAIDAIMATRDARFDEFRAAWMEGPAAVLAFCETLPHIGAVTKFHLAKNLGLDFAKPDVWLVRVATVSGETPHELCARLSRASCDSVALVAYVIWRACQQGFWVAPPSAPSVVPDGAEGGATQNPNVEPT